MDTWIVVMIAVCVIFTWLGGFIMLLNDEFQNRFVGGAVLAVAVIVLAWAVQTGNYKRGQIDALTGSIEYELIEHTNGTKSWESLTEDE